MQTNVEDPGERALYLSQFWQRYPRWPENCQIFGRIKTIDRQNSLFHFESQRAKSFQPQDVISTKLFMDGSEHMAEAILVPGDVVAVNSLDRVILLAPNLESGLPSRGLINLNRTQANKNINASTTDLLQRWSDFLFVLRDFFRQRHFLEVQTPLLVECPGTEPSLEHFETDFFVGSKKKKFFLPTSPELHLKKLLCRGAEKVFEISTSFRNGELTERHQPEFKILEFYEAFADLKSTKKLVIDLNLALCDYFKIQPPAKVVSYSMAELFLKFCNFELLPDTTLDELRNLAMRLGVDIHAATTIDDFFFLIFIEKIEFQWPKDELVFVEKYPPYQAALARLDENGWADRFEFYWQGLELGNAFNELNDPQLQKLRALEDLEKKRQVQNRPIALDEDFFDALSTGMPPSAGIAMGLERMFMSLFDVKAIQDVVVFAKVLDSINFEK